MIGITVNQLLPKIVTKIPKGFNFYYKKLFLLIIKVKNFIILIFLFQLLKTSFEDRHKKMFTRSKNITLVKIIIEMIQRFVFVL